MPRRTKKQKNKEKKLAVALAGVLVLAVVSALMLTVPAFDGWVRQLLGFDVAVTVPQTSSNSAVGVHIIDVGQGDAVLLEADGEYALVDAGPPEAAATVAAYLKAAKVPRLRYLVMTHPHADHYGGMQTVLESVPVDKVLLPDLSLAPMPTASLFMDLLQVMLDKNIPTETALQCEYPLGGGYLRVLHTGLASDDNHNLLSLGVLFEAGGLRFLNTGDAEKTNEATMLKSEVPLSADVFLAGHHGSSTSNTRAFLQAVSPSLVVVSCAAGNSYGHPHASPLKTYDAVGAEVLRTDKLGHVVVRPDGAGGLVYAVSRPKEA